MKTKYFIGIISLLILAGSTLNGQRSYSQDYRNDDAPLVVNNYYNDYDYSFTSRINRFHRSYVSFDYYNPFFSDPYWYDYQPYSEGINIYAGFGSGFGFGFGNDWGYNPYFGINSYWGYDPFYYSSWYSPYYFNFGFGNRWNYNSGRFSHSVYTSMHNSGSNRESVSRGSIGRRQDPSVNSSRNTYNNRNLTNRSNNTTTTGNRENRRNSFNNGNLTNRSGNGISNTETRRYSYASVNQNNSNNRNWGNSLSCANTGRNNGSGYAGRSISSGAASTPQIHSSSSRSFSSGPGLKSMSSHSASHSSSKSSGSRSGSSGGRSSRRR